jgi:hypothetical protein
MTYCTDEEVVEPGVPRMPYAPEGSLMHEQPRSFWMSLLQNMSRGAAPQCQEDIHQYEHFSGCPYIAPAKLDRPQLSVPAVAAPKGRGQDECCEEAATPAPKIHKTKYQAVPKSKEDCPRHPEVDTMEYRKSDGGLNEYGPGPY